MARFEEIGANLGVDSVKVGAEWMMVPLGGENLVRLTDGEGYTVAEPVGHRLTIRDVTKEFAKETQRLFGVFAPLLLPTARVFSVGSHTRGEAKIVATKGARTTTLSVTVHPKRTFKVAFFFLQDRSKDGTVSRRTAFGPDSATSWIRDLNGVFLPQANIAFELTRAELLPVEGLSASVGSAKSDLAALAAVRQTSGAQIAVFLAGGKIQSNDSRDPLGFYDRDYKVILVRDQFATDPWSKYAAPMLKTIAHEIGHYMNDVRGAGGDHDYYLQNGYNSDILNTLDGNDIKISHQRVLDWNPW